MTDMPQSPPSAAPAPEYPSFNFPVAYADAVGSVSWERGIVKFYMVRNSPEFRAAAPARGC
jgi:hypothetical protein